MMNSNNAKAVVLVSGGLDSATCLAIARSQGYACYALSFNYGQRSISELNGAKKLVRAAQVESHKIISLDIGELGGSALTDDSIEVPEEETRGIPLSLIHI